MISTDTVRVLHVDDDPDLLTVASVWLEREAERLDVVHATSVADAMQTLATHEVDCIVSDYDMPRQNGIEFLELARAAYPGIPFIFFTGSDDVVRLALSAGATDVVKKGTGGSQYAMLASRIIRAVECHEAGHRHGPTNRRPVSTNGGVRTTDPKTEVDRLALLTAQNAATREGMAVVDDDRTVRSYNDRFLVILNLDESHVEDADTDVLEAVADNVVDTERFRQTVESLEDTPTVEHCDEFRLTDGRWVDLFSCPVVGETGVRYGRLWSVRDVTDTRQRELDLARSGTRFEEFASIVSHDLRNPLNVAGGYLEIARESNDSEALAEVARAHERMRTLIDDLLLLARVDETITGQEPVSLRALAERCWRNVRTGDAELHIDTDRVVMGDESRLCQLVENLVRNAIEHGRGSGSTGDDGDGNEPVEPDGEPVVISVGDVEDGFFVADDGDGIPEALRDVVFESGYSTRSDGTGFGLTIVKKIADAHGWEIAVCDAPDGGARFEFTGVEVL